MLLYAPPSRQMPLWKRAAVSLGSRRPPGVLLGGVLAIMALAMAISAVTRSQPDLSRPSAAAPFTLTRESVCRAADAARSGNPPEIPAMFFDRLQELAGAVREVDRNATARLLEAKGRVESDLENGSSELAEDLDNLAVITGQAMAAVGGRDPGTCKR